MTAPTPSGDVSSDETEAVPFVVAKCDGYGKPIPGEFVTVGSMEVLREPSADVSSLIEVVARAIAPNSWARKDAGGHGVSLEQEIAKSLSDARAAIAAHDTEAAIVLKRYREALERLELANEEVAATRSAETYLSMIDNDGASDALLALDAARSNARAALKAGA